MIYSLEYFYTCHRGKARRINQDNLVCGETFLPVMHEDTLAGSSVPVTPDNPFLFAAFDGIGGEAYGESASAIAAETFHNWDFQRYEQSLIDGCLESNRRITRFAAQNRLRACGTTAAMLLFSHHCVVRCNIGDSRIYRFHGNKLRRLSESDSFPGRDANRKYLSQYLGMPEKEILIQPHTERFAVVHGDVYLVCTDGLTDMVTEKKILSIVRNMDPGSACRALLQAALDAGGPDDITFFLVRIQTSG